MAEVLGCFFKGLGKEKKTNSDVQSEEIPTPVGLCFGATSQGYGKMLSGGGA